MTRDGIKTLGWLRATESLLHFFGESSGGRWTRTELTFVCRAETFAPAAASLAGADIREDIRVRRDIFSYLLCSDILQRQRIRAHYLSAPVECRTLELLVAHELPQRRKLATEALIWCVR